MCETALVVLASLVVLADLWSASPTLADQYSQQERR